MGKFDSPKKERSIRYERQVVARACPKGYRCWMGSDQASLPATDSLQRLQAARVGNPLYLLHRAVMRPCVASSVLGQLVLCPIPNMLSVLFPLVLQGITRKTHWQVQSRLTNAQYRQVPDSAVQPIR